MKTIQITFFVTNLLLTIFLKPTFAFTAIDSNSISSDTVISQADSQADSQSITPDSINQQKAADSKLVKNDSSNINLNNDSLQQKNRRILLESRISARSSIFKRTDTINSHSPFIVKSDVIYRSDMSSPSELLRENPLIISTPFGLSSSLNRFLHYGNTAPITLFNSGRLLDNAPTHPLAGTDQKFLTETATLHIHPGYLTYENPSHKLATPEVLLYWENGVFDENILNVKFSRPFSKTLVAHIFSNYRYFKSKPFNHIGNDVFSFFKTFQDSADVSYKGYNPLTDEKFTGAGFQWADEGHSANFSIQYGEFNNEIALNKDNLENNNYAALAKFSRYPLSLNTGLSLKLSELWYADFETQYTSEPVIRITGEELQGYDNTQKVRKDAKETLFGAALRSGRHVFQGDSAGALYKINSFKRKAFNDSEKVVIQHKPELYFNKRFQSDNYSAKFAFDAGTAISSFKDSTRVNLLWHASTDMTLSNKQLRIFLQQDIIPFISEFDSVLTNTYLIDDYFQAGWEIYLNYSVIDLLLGYQLVTGITNQSVENAWPSGTPPYKQQKSTFVIAPDFTLKNDLSLKTHLMISDAKPYFKVYGSLNYTVHPVNTDEYIDFKLYTEFWSEREPTVFADSSNDWNKPILNTGIEIAAHIRSFRLFYKVDNLLNRHFAYIPGYHSPGITFRWGFNWFIQR